MANVYDSNFDTTPAASDLITDGDQAIRDKAVALKTALGTNHVVATSVTGYEYTVESDAGKHLVVDMVTITRGETEGTKYAPAFLSYGALFRRKVGTVSGGSGSVTETRMKGNDGVTTAIGFPVGTIIDFASQNVPAGWLLCNGQLVSQAIYADLFAVIQTTWNTGGEDYGFFRVPNFVGKITAGSGTNTDDNSQAATFPFAGTIGENAHRITVEELTPHAHGIKGNGFWYKGTDVGEGSYNHGNRSDKNVDAYTEVAGGNAFNNNIQAFHNNIQPTVGVYKLIKY